MIWICLVLLVLTLGFVAGFSNYEREELFQSFQMKGIYRRLYPPAWFLYKNVLCRIRAKKKSFDDEDVSEQEERVREETLLKNISLSILILLISSLLALAAAANAGGDLIDQYYIERNEQGEGDLKIDLTAQVGDVSEDISLNIREKMVASEDMEEFQELCRTYILKHVLGENESLSNVTTDLNFFDEISEYSVDVSWQSGDYSLIRSDGSLKNEELEEETSVELTAVCTYFEESWECVFEVVVYPALKDEEEQLQEALYEAIEAAQDDDESLNYLILPDSLNGETIQWSQKTDSQAGLLLLLGLAMIALLFAREGESRKKAREERSQQLMMDYPVLVHKMVLLLGAGLTVKAAWFRIVSDYEKALQDGGERRFLYEEMKRSANEMKQGLGEIAAYERFGRRCQSGQYLKFSSILIQSVKTGAKGMSRMLAEAGEEALLLHRENAKRTGEAAGTKLLFPMMLLLGLLMIIIMVPAFMSINIL